MDLVGGRVRAGIRSVGLLAGGFNPPTVAHVALLEAAAEILDQVACVVPRSYPHKEYFGAGFEQRVEMLAALRYPVLAASGGLFIEIAREFRRDILPDAAIHFICGRDAAERIVGWDYGEPGEIDRQFEEFSLLVAARAGEYEPPSHLARGVRVLTMDAAFDAVSSTLVRQLLQEGNEQWRQYVPESIEDRVRRIYI